MNIEQILKDRDEAIERIQAKRLEAKTCADPIQRRKLEKEALALLPELANMAAEFSGVAKPPTPEKQSSKITINGKPLTRGDNS